MSPSITLNPIFLSVISTCSYISVKYALIGDHAGGNEKIKELVPGIKVYGGSIDNVKGCTKKVENGVKLSLGDDINILAFHKPCHTKGHISYYLTGKEEEDPAVFTGDTLFVAGCGKVFEGAAEQMYQSCVTLASLPNSTRVYCGHEYTVKNLQFAQTVEPDNESKTKLCTFTNLGLVLTGLCLKGQFFD